MISMHIVGIRTDLPEYCRMMRRIGFGDTYLDSYQGSDRI
jgi:hypothetical protein